MYPLLHVDNDADVYKTSDLDPMIKYLIDGSLPGEILEDLITNRCEEDLLLYFKDKGGAEEAVQLSTCRIRKESYWGSP